MKKRFAFTVLGLILVVAVLGGIKALQIRKMIAAGESFVMPPAPITTATVTREVWNEGLSAVGSVEAVQGVEITAELTGKVVEIAFTPGTLVKKGDLLLRQDTSAEQAQLRGAQSSLTLAKLELQRAKDLRAQNLNSQSQLDNASATFDGAAARVEELEATIAKKTLRAPFSGRVGLRRVSLGQVIGEGQAITLLNSVDPVWVTFTLPQQHLGLLTPGLPVEVSTSAAPEAILKGTLTAMDAGIDPNTRSAVLQATIPNPEQRLIPGMFVRVSIGLSDSDEYLLVPQTAILNAPFGDQVFVVQEQPASEGQPGGMTVEARFVRLGERRGDLVAVLSGVAEGDVVASTGVFKLRNGQGVVISDAGAPEFQADPNPGNQ